MNLIKKVLTAVCALSLIAGQNVYAGRLMVTAEGFSENESSEKTFISAHINTRIAGPEYSSIFSYAHADLKLKNPTTEEIYDIHADGMMRASPYNSPKVRAWASFYGDSDPDGIFGNTDDTRVVIYLAQNSPVSGQDTYRVTLEKRADVPWDYVTIYDSTHVVLQGGNVHVRYVEDKNIKDDK